MVARLEAPMRRAELREIKGRGRRKFMSFLRSSVPASPGLYRRHAAQPAFARRGGCRRHQLSRRGRAGCASFDDAIGVNAGRWSSTLPAMSMGLAADPQSRGFNHLPYA